MKKKNPIKKIKVECEYCSHKCVIKMTKEVPVAFCPFCGKEYSDELVVDETEEELKI